MQKLFALATEMFQCSASPARTITQERRSGATVTRRLYTLTVSDVEELGFSGAQELWRVEQDTVTDAGKRTVEVRFFISERDRAS